MGDNKTKKKTRKILTMAERAQVLREMQQGLSNAKLCKKYGLHSSSVSTFWKNREAIFKACEENICNLKRMRPFNKCELDAPLYQWYKETTGRNEMVNVAILQEQVERIARQNGDTKFKCSVGWIDGFKRRHGISFRATNRAGTILPAPARDPLEMVRIRPVQTQKMSDETDVICIEEHLIKVEEEEPTNMNLICEKLTNESSTAKDFDVESSEKWSISSSQVIETDAKRSKIDHQRFIDDARREVSSSDAKAALHTLYRFYESNCDDLDPSFFEHYAKLKVMVDEFHRNRCDKRVA